MKTKFKNKQIIVNATNYEEVNYDIGTNKYCTSFDGRGGITYFHYVNSKHNFQAHSYMNFYFDDQPMSIFGKKKVINCGRIQKIIYMFDDGKIIITQYGYESYIFYKINYKFDCPKNIIMGNDYAGFVNVPIMASNMPFEYIENTYTYYFKVENQKEATFNMVLSFTDNPKPMVKKANTILKSLNKEIDSIVPPSSCDTEMKKALYTSCMFVALENFKSIEGFAGLAAGVNYLLPFRTYYRDSYWTMLCLYKQFPEIIKNQIIQLADGIKDDGECPSAVRPNHEVFWGGHYDSPCFFVMMTFDYISHTGDKELLNTVIKDNSTTLDLCKRVMNRLINLCDSTHLLVKKGPYNRLDWADEVNRNGYVTYDECLYYRALYCLGKMIGGENVYSKEARLVKDAINKIMWSKEKQYYVNYIDGDFIEDNLCVDTILTALFNIVPEENKEVLLDNFENILYSKNHQELKDYGVLSVYPNYRRHFVPMNKSGQPFRYHNGANWPYWNGMFAYMLMKNNRDYEYALSHWFTYNIQKNNFTPIEYFSPYYKDGSLLQAWSATPAFALLYCQEDFFLL